MGADQFDPIFADHSQNKIIFQGFHFAQNNIFSKWGKSGGISNAAATHKPTFPNPVELKSM